MIKITKEITLLNKDKVLSALYQLKNEVPKMDLAELLGIDNRNITRYFKGYVEAGLIKKWQVPLGKTRMTILEITPEGIKEAKKLPKQVSLTVIPDKEPETEKEAKIRIKKEVAEAKTITEVIHGKTPKVAIDAKTSEVPTIEYPKIIISKEKKKLKFELMTYINKLPIRAIDYRLFSFKSSAEMRSKMMEIISEL